MKDQLQIIKTISDTNLHITQIVSGDIFWQKSDNFWQKSARFGTFGLFELVAAFSYLYYIARSNA